MPPDVPVTLVTGFPNPIARRLVRLAVGRGERAVLLSPPKHVDLAREFVHELEGEKGAAEVLVGEVPSLDLGLSGAELKRLSRDVRRIHHVAAVQYAGVTGSLMERVNVDGTRNVLELAADASRLERLVFHGTAFVAGTRGGILLEDELDPHTTFRNAFERTKFEAERLVRARAGSLPVSIVRPSAIVADPRAGDGEREDGFQRLVQAVMAAPRHSPLPLPGNGDNPLNLVPADFVAAAADAVGRDPSAIGKTFHLVDPNPLPGRRVVEVIAAAAGGHRQRATLADRAWKALLQLGPMRRLVPEESFLQSFTPFAVYHAGNALPLLSAAGLLCPPLAAWAPGLVRYVRARLRATEVRRRAEAETAEEEESLRVIARRTLRA